MKTILNNKQIQGGCSDKGANPEHGCIRFDGAVASFRPLPPGRAAGERQVAMATAAYGSPERADSP
ncbi:hypothetical protein YWS52_16460 [Chitiniphilus shinanonensis]